MEETAPQNVPPPDDIMTPQDSLEQSTTSVAPTTSLEGAGRDPARISDGGAEIVNDAPEQKHFGSFLQNKLLRKVGLASGVLLGIIALLVVGTLIFQKTHKTSLSQAEKVGQIKDQSVKLQDTTASTGPNSLRTGVATLFVNGDVSVQGLLRFNNGANYGQVDSSSLTSNQTYKLPNASGTICLDSGNCQFASAADLAAVQSTASAAGAAAGALEAAANATKYTGGSGVTITGSVITNSGVLSVNGSVGDINLQGTANQVIITSANGVSTFALPQDIGLSSSPTFGGLVLSSVGTQNGFNLCDQSNNCGYGVNSIVQGGNAFGTDVQVGASDNSGLQLLTNNTNRFSITNNGAITIGGANSDRITALAQFSGSTPLVFQGGTDDFFTTSLVITNPTSNRNIILPNADGTVCLSSGNCSGAGGYGDVLNGGNNFNSTMTLGTNDNFGFNLKTNNVNRITISNTGTTALLGNVTSAADVVLGTNSTNRLTINSQITGATPFIFQGATNDGFATTFSITDPTANHNITFPNADGTVCLSSGNCTGPVGTGDVLQGGNNFGGTMILGTNDNFGFDFKTNNTTRLTISNTGAAAFAGDLTVAGNNVFGASSANRITFNGQVLGGAPLVFQGATDNAFATFLLVSDPTATRTITLPNADGTICLSSGNCSTSGGTGDVNNGGNNYNSTMVLGTNDNFGLNLKTNNTVRLSITNGGQVTVQGNFLVNGDTLLGATSAQSVTFQAQNLFAPNDLNIDTYTQYIDTTNNQVGFGTLPLGTARVGILATNAGDALTVNNGQSAGNILNLQDNGVNVVTVANEGYTTFRNTTNNASAFQIQNAAGATIVNTDTTNRTLNVNGGPSTYSFTPTGPILANPISYTVGSRPYGVAFGNFNGDAYPDMVSANSSSDNASVLINNGNGTFANKVDYATTPGNSTPQYVAVGDFNADGRDDFVVTNYYGLAVSVFINNGNGTFAARADYAIQGRSFGVAVADLNADGKPDIVANDTANGGDLVSVLINNGNGTFATKVDYATCSLGASTRVATADFNSDGSPDMAISCNTTNTDQIAILTNNGNGTFAAAVRYTTASTGGGTYDIKTGDFNSDGKPDIVTGDYYGSRVSVYLNNGVGLFGAQVNYTVGFITMSVAVADFNGDGIQDIAASNTNSSSISLLLGNGNGTFQGKVDYTTNLYNVGVLAAADVNLDGKQDLAEAASVGNTVGIMLGSGSTTTVKNSLSVATPSANETALFIKQTFGQIADLIRVADSNGSSPILSLSGTGALYLKNTTNSTSALQVQNTAGTNVLEVDTTNSRVGVNLGSFVTPSNTFTVNGLTTADSTAQVAIGTGAVGNKGLVIQGIASQTANLFEAQISTGTAVASIGATGATLFKNSADSTTAFQIQNAAGTSLFTADTTNTKVSISSVTSVLSAWTTSAVSMPGNRYNGTMGYYNGYAYYVGDEGSLTPNYVKLNADGTTGAWANGTALAERRASAAGVVANGYYYLLGGLNATVKVNTVLYAKLNADGTMGTWQTAANALPQTLSGGSAITANGYIYHIGGSNGSAIATVYYARVNADGSVGAWQTSANALPGPRSGGAATVSNGYVYYTGGVSTATVYYAALNPDGTTGAWSTNANALPGVRSNHTLVAFNGTLYNIGGTDASAPTNTVYYATTNANGSVNAWTTSAFTLPTARNQHSSTVANGFVYTFGGQLAPNGVVYYTRLPGATNGLTVTPNLTTLYGSLQVQNADGTNFINADITNDTLAVNGATTIKSVNIGANALTVQGASGQLSDLIQAQDYLGTSLFAVTAAGNISLGKEAAHSISIADSTTTNVAGGALSVTAGSGNGTGAGGNLNLLAGQSGLTNGATAGTVNITAGSSGAGFGNAGNVNITAGNGFSTPGNITIQAGNNGFASYGSTSINTGGGKTMIGSSASGFYLDSNVNLTVSGGNVYHNALVVPVISTVSTGSSYYYVVTAYNGQGETLASNSVGMADNTSTITWSVVPGATGYKLYRNTSNSFASGSLLRTTITVPGTVSFLDTGAATGAGLPPTTTTGTKTVVQSWSGQTANLQEWQSSTGTVLASVGSTGVVNATNGVTLGNNVQLKARNFANNADVTLMYLDTSNQTHIDSGAGTFLYAANTLVVKTLSNRVEITKPLLVNNTLSALGTNEKFRVTDVTTVDNLANVQIGTSATTAKGVVIQGVASQTASLQEWQTSTGAVLASVGATGAVSYKNSADSAAAFQIQNAAGTNLFNADTTNNQIKIGGAASATPTLLILADGNSTDPTGTNGAIYYNSALGKFRCYQGGTWTNCIGTGGGGGGDIAQGGNTFGVPVVIGASDAFALNFITSNTTRLSISASGAVAIGATGTAGTVEKLRVNTPTTVDNLAATILSTGAAGNKALVIQGAASQTANLQEWQTSAGTVLGSMGSSGILTLNRNVVGVGTYGGVALADTSGNIYGKIDLTQSGSGSGASGGISFSSRLLGSVSETVRIGDSTSNTVLIKAQAAASSGLVIQGAASQTANLQEWQNSAGTVLASMGATGSFNAAAVRTTSGPQLTTTNDTAAYGGGVSAIGGISVYHWNSSINLTPGEFGGVGFVNTLTTSASGAITTTLTTAKAASVVVAVKGAASQSANLQEWQSSAGTVLAYVSSAGRIKVASGGSAGLLIGTTAGLTTSADAGNLNINNPSLGQYIFINPSATGIIYLGSTTDTAAIEARRQVNISSTADAIKLQIQGAATQTTDLQQWQTNGGAVLASIGGSGSAFFKNSADSTTAFRVQNAAGTNLFTTDTTNNQIKIGGAASATPTLFVFADGNSGTDPTGTNGAMYYNSSLGKFRCYQAGAWANCIGAGGGGGGDVNNGGNNYGSTMVLGTLDAQQLNLITSNQVRLTISSAGAVAIGATGTAGTVEKLRVGTPTTTDNAANTILTPLTINDKALVIQALPSQNASVFEVQNSAGTPVVYINSGQGSVRASSFGSTSSSKALLTANGDTSGFLLTTTADANKGLSIRANSATQSANLQEWQDSTGTALASVSSSGDLSVAHTGNATITVRSTNSSRSSLQLGTGGSGPRITSDAVNGALDIETGANQRVRITSGGAFEINSTGTAGTVEKFRVNTPTTVDNSASSILSTGATTSKGLVIQGVASQSANLFEVQDSAGGVMASIGTASGGLLTVGVTRSTFVQFGASNWAGSGTVRLSNNAAINWRDSTNSFDYGINLDAANNLVLNTAGAITLTAGQSVRIASPTGTQGTVEKLRVGTPTTVDNLANVIFSASATTSKPLVVQGASSQTANLQEWQNFNGSVVASISSSGTFDNGSQGINTGTATVSNSVRVGSNVASVGAVRLQNNTNIAWRNAANSADFTLGLNASNILETSSGTIVQFTSGAIQFSNTSAAGGQIRLPNAGSGIRVRNAANSADILALTVTSSDVLQLAAAVTTNDATATTSIGTTGTAKKGLVIQGVASQTANLQEWQDSAGANLASVSAAGNVTATSFTIGSSQWLGSNLNLVNNGGNVNISNAVASGNVYLNSGTTSGFVGVKTGNVEVARFVTGGGLEIGSTGAVGTVEKFRVGTPTTTDNSAVTILTSVSAANKSLVVQGVASQTGNLQEWQSSAGVVLASVDASGNMTLNGSLNISTGTLQVAGVDRIDNTGSLVNVTYNGSTIAVAKGGTGNTNFTANGILFGNGSGAVQSTAAGNSGQCLNAVTGSAPVWASCTPAATGNVNQGGNNFGSDVTLGATDNFGINLLANNVAVAKFSASGQATFQNGTDSVTALQVQNAAGTSLFNIDSTNSRVYVGNPTADGTGTLLVLDTKNTSGDPTGVNGAMYYNSNLGKFRCYEGGSWKDCIYSQQTATKTSDQTMSSTSYADVGSLSFNVVANQTYKLSCSLLVSVPSGTNGGNLSTNGPASPSQYTATFAKSLDQSSGDNYATSSTYDDGSSATTFKVNTVSTGSNRFIVSYNSILVNGANSGTWSLRGKAFDGSSSITFYANSSCDLKPL